MLGSKVKLMVVVSLIMYLLSGFYTNTYALDYTQWLGQQAGSQGLLGQLNYNLINPQPEPPGSGMWGLTQSGGFGSFSNMSAVMFNPQPEPPVSWSQVGMQGIFGNSLNYNLINPQPEPPGSGMWGLTQSGGFGIFSNMSAVMFNPQPEPPGSWVQTGTQNLFGRTNYNYLNPQPEPPAPGGIWGWIN